MLNVIKYFNHLKAYDSIKACSQSHIFTYESINTCEYVETSCLYSDFVLLSISKLTGTQILISVYCYYSEVI